jgi:hypothetical protein
MNADDQDLPGASDLESKAQSLQKQRESLVTDVSQERYTVYKWLGLTGNNVAGGDPCANRCLQAVRPAWANIREGAFPLGV